MIANNLFSLRVLKFDRFAGTRKEDGILSSLLDPGECHHLILRLLLLLLQPLGFKRASVDHSLQLH